MKYVTKMETSNGEQVRTLTMEKNDEIRNRYITITASDIKTDEITKYNGNDIMKAVEEGVIGVFQKSADIIEILRLRKVEILIKNKLEYLGVDNSIDKYFLKDVEVTDNLKYFDVFITPKRKSTLFNVGDNEVLLKSTYAFPEPVESFIYSYINDCSNENFEEGVRKLSTGYAKINKTLLRKDNNYYCEDELVYVRDPEALFQRVGCPIYITSDGYLYIAYINIRHSNLDYAGFLKYRIKERPEKFVNDIVKLKFLYGGI